MTREKTEGKATEENTFTKNVIIDNIDAAGYNKRNIRRECKGEFHGKK